LTALHNNLMAIGKKMMLIDLRISLSIVFNNQLCSLGKRIINWRWEKRCRAFSLITNLSIWYDPLFR